MGPNLFQLETIPGLCIYYALSVYSKSDYGDILLTNRFISGLIARIWTLIAATTALGEETTDHLLAVFPTWSLAVESGARGWQRTSNVVAAVGKIDDASDATELC